MGNIHHLQLLGRGAGSWNEWREREPDVRPDLSSADLRGANLSGMDLSGASLSRADLRKAVLAGALLKGCNLAGSNLESADLSGANLSEANLAGATLLRANLSGANLRNANLAGANLSDGLNLSGADLSAANLAGAKLVGVILCGATLKAANLAGADVRDAVLAGANLTDAAMAGARFDGADLSVATRGTSDAAIGGESFDDGVVEDGMPVSDEEEPISDVAIEALLQPESEPEADDLSGVIDEIEEEASETEVEVEAELPPAPQIDEPLGEEQAVEALVPVEEELDLTAVEEPAAAEEEVEEEEALSEEEKVEAEVDEEEEVEEEAAFEETLESAEEDEDEAQEDLAAADLSEPDIEDDQPQSEPAVAVLPPAQEDPLDDRVFSYETKEMAILALYSAQLAKKNKADQKALIDLMVQYNRTFFSPDVRVPMTLSGNALMVGFDNPTDALRCGSLYIDMLRGMEVESYVAINWGVATMRWPEDEEGHDELIANSISLSARLMPVGVVGEVLVLEELYANPLTERDLFSFERVGRKWKAVSSPNEDGVDVICYSVSTKQAPAGQMAAGRKPAGKKRTGRS